ncbi:MAG: hypothetical protein M1828_004709 [Chrysothrix sp. TS-e1954]|nr:MAG: hypothetical protein M1828_004709 [Chrysothrix sp. TS-e1954]
MNTYDSDDGLRRRSPGLERIEYSYKPTESPLPTPQRRRQEPDPKRSRTDASPSSGRDRRRSIKKPKSNQANYVLLRQLEPNRPDIAHEARQRPLESESSSDPVDELDDEGEMTKGIEGQAPSSSKFKQLHVTDNERPAPPPSIYDPPRSSMSYESNGPKNVANQYASHQDHNRRDSNTSNSIATSPTLQPHLIEPSQRPASEQLAALNAEPSPTSGGSSNPPPNDASLPPIGTLMHEISQNNTPGADAYAYDRTNSAPQQLGPRSSVSQPYTYAPRSSTDPHSRRPSEIFPSQLPSRNNSIMVQSPASYGPDSRHNFARITDPSPTSATFPRSSVSSVLSQTTTGSVTEGFSPTSQATTVETNQTTDSTRSTLPASTPPPGPSASTAVGIYKCNFEGCSALPFQTQYLLK